MIRKVLSLISLCLLLVAAAAAEGEGFRIASVTLDSKGKTDPKMLLRQLAPVDRAKVFASKEELEAYLDFIRQQLENTRLLEDITYTYDVQGDGGADDGRQQGRGLLVDAVYSFKDSKSLMIVPYPTYSSNTGLQATLMVKDQNFLGKTNPFTAYANCSFGTEEEPDNFSKITPGFGLGYDFPFSVGPVQASWRNAVSFAWTIGNSMPEFNALTGPYLAIPVGSQELDFSFFQAAVRNRDFERYDDELYFKELARISMPLTVAKIGTATPLVYRPYVEASYNWDMDGIDDSNYRLSASPKLTVGQSIGVNAVDWKGNFRNGFSFSTTQAISRNFNEHELTRGLIPYIGADLKLFKAWKYAGVSANLQFFTMFNTRNDESSLINIGPRLRGAMDKQPFSTQDGYSGGGVYNFALETDQAVILSLEAPFHLVTTKFSGFLSAVNVEMQLSPFVDVALFKNRARKNGEAIGKIFDIHEGVYCAGIEGFLYPTKFKSFVLHTSVGFDVGSYLIKDYNGDWRKPEKGWELSIGFGHHF